MRTSAEALRSCAQWIVHLGMTGRLLLRRRKAPSRPILMRGSSWQAAVSCALSIRGASAAWNSAISVAKPHSARQAMSRSPLASANSPHSSAAAAYRSRQLCSTKPCLPASAISMPMKASFTPAFGRGDGPTGLTLAELDRLRLALRQILTHAIRLGGSSVSDYVDADGERGFFQLEHCVYQRTGEPCRRCQTPIRRIIVAGRGTHYCPTCQR